MWKQMVTATSLAAAVGGCALGDAPVAADAPIQPAPALVEVGVVAQGAVTEQAALHGVVRAVDRSTLAFAVGGRLLERRVDVGDRVRAGEVLARIDGRAYRFAERAAAATIDELNAQREQLSRDEARLRALRSDGVSSTQQLESTQTGLSRLTASREAASQQLRESRRRRTETVLRAPFDGVVRAVMIDEGTVVAPGTPVLALAGNGGAEVHVSCPERVALWLTPGASARVELPATSEQVSGRVVAVSDAAGPSGLFSARIALPNATAAGRSAIVHLAHEQPDTELRVPLRAIVDPSGDRPYLWKVAGEAVHRVPIRIRALREDTWASIDAEGLAAEDRVVVAGHRPLLEGDTITFAGAEQ